MAEEPPGGFLTLSDLEEAASKNALEPAWAYVQGGAGEELTMKANREAFRRRTLRPRALINVENLELATTILNEKVSAPFYVSPTAYQGLLHPDAELATARAASSASILAIFSTISSRSLEDIAQAAPTGPPLVPTLPPTRKRHHSTPSRTGREGRLYIPRPHSRRPSLRQPGQDHTGRVQCKFDPPRKWPRRFSSHASHC